MSLRRSLLVLACLLVWAESAQAAVACSSTNFATGTGSTNVALVVTFPTANSGGDSKHLGIFNRTDETTTIVSVVGTSGDTWTLLEGPIDATTGLARAWTYYSQNATAGTEVVTVTFSGAINSVGVGGWCTGASTSAALDASATPTQLGSVTNWDSNAAAASTAGGVIGFTITPTNSVTFTIDGAGESQLSCSARVCAFFEPYASAGNYGFELTASTTAPGIMLVSAFKEPGAAAGCTGGLLLLGAGKCD